MEEASIKTPSLKTQSAWLLFAKVVGFVFSLVLPLLIVRFLTQEEVGIYRQVFLVIINANIILQLGFGMSVYYFLSRSTAERRGAVVFNTLLFNFAAGAIACLVLFVYPQLLGNIFQSEQMTRLAPEIGIVIWLWIFSTFLETVAIANREPKMATAFIILAQFTKTALMLLAVMIFATVESFVYAAMVQALIQSVILLIYLSSRFPKFWLEFDPKFFREQFFYALPFGLAGLLWTLQTDIHNYFVGYRFSDAEFAIYAVGCFELPLIGMLADSVASVMIPRMSELESSGDKSGFYAVELISHKLFRYAVPLFLFLIFLSSAVLAVSSKVFELIFWLQIVFFAVVLLTWILERGKKNVGVLAIPLYFVLTNTASVIGFYKFLRGEKFTRWEPIREAKQPDKNIETFNQTV